MISRSPESQKTDPLTSEIIGAAIEVHRHLGPGLLESTYEACLSYELRLKKFKVECQKPLPVIYKGVLLDCGYRLDMARGRSSDRRNKIGKGTRSDS